MHYFHHLASPDFVNLISFDLLVFERACVPLSLSLAVSVWLFCFQFISFDVRFQLNCILMELKHGSLQINEKIECAHFNGGKIARKCVVCKREMQWCANVHTLLVIFLTVISVTHTHTHKIHIHSSCQRFFFIHSFIRSPFFDFIIFASIIEMSKFISQFPRDRTRRVLNAMNILLLFTFSLDFSINHRRFVHHETVKSANTTAIARKI